MGGKNRKIWKVEKLREKNVEKLGKKLSDKNDPGTPADYCKPTVKQRIFILSECLSVVTVATRAAHGRMANVTITLIVRETVLITWYPHLKIIRWTGIYDMHNATRYFSSHHNLDKNTRTKITRECLAHQYQVSGTYDETTLIAYE